MQGPAEHARISVPDAPLPTAAEHGHLEPRPSSERSLTVYRGDGTPLLLGAGRCALMGIINVTPDSFSDGGRYRDSEQVLARIDELIAEGAELIDVGAESTRPGAQLLTATQEWDRLRELFAALARRRTKAVLSIDTRHLLIAQRAAAAGFRVLNLTFPQHLLLPTEPVAASFSSPRLTPALVLPAFDGVVVMHSRGTPATMRQLTDYGPDLCNTVITELADVVSALTDTTLRDRVIYDPGLGFAKTAEQSLALLGQLGRLRAALGGPVLVGASRKSVLGGVTGLAVADRLLPSVVAAALAAYQGAAIVRVHDVAATRAALQVCAAVAAAVQAAPAVPARGGA